MRVLLTLSTTSTSILARRQQHELANTTNVRIERNLNLVSESVKLVQACDHIENITKQTVQFQQLKDISVLCAR